MHLPKFVVSCRASLRPGFRAAAVAASLLSLATAVVAPAASVPGSARWDVLRQDDLRVASVGYRLSVANRRLCPASPVPQPGFVVHGIAQYSTGDRADAARRFGLGEHNGVMAVVAGSPAAQAGLRADDLLLSVNGRALGQPVAAGMPPSQAPVEADRQILAAEMLKGAIVLRLSRAEGVRELRFAAEMGCATNIAMVPGVAVNAWADGHGVVVSSALLARCATDDDLALVIAHEMAHNLLHHASRTPGTALGVLPAASAADSAAMRETEEEADQLGVRLAASAYDLRGAAAFMGGLMAQEGNGAVSSTHPAPARRLALLAAAIARERVRPAG
jgi:hypothetical protein